MKRRMENCTGRTKACGIIIMFEFFLTMIIPLFFFLFLSLTAYSQNNIIFFPNDDEEFAKPVQTDNPERIYGVTLDAVSGLNNITSTLARHNKRMTARIVFDEWQPATNYTNAVNRIDSISDIMGELLDSYYMSQYSRQQYISRTAEYLNAFGNKVDIWEVGNEVNGEWLGHTDSVVSKIYNSFWMVKKYGKAAAITLYYNHNCWEDPGNEMFRWAKENIPAKMKLSLDYVFVSYYEDDCNGYQPNWQQVFDSLRVIFPYSKLGIGECGTVFSSRKAEYITRYYTMNITTPNYVGGYFWWYYKQDCVPWNTKPLWQVLDNAIMNTDRTNIVKPGDWK